MQRLISVSNVDSELLTEWFNKLKDFYKTDSVSEDKKQYIVDKVKKYGYLPYSHIGALEKFSTAEILLGLEEKFKHNDIYDGEKFTYKLSEISPVKRLAYKDSSWCKIEGHNIKLINLAGLGDGNKSQVAGKFADWLVQLLILPSGNVKKGVLATTAYLIPFHPREFGCAYIPTSSGVSLHLEDNELKESFGIDAKQQVQLFLLLTQLAGHPTMFDVLPQTGRFSKTIIANPYLARWFDIKELTQKLEIELNRITESLKSEFESEKLYIARDIVFNAIKGQYQSISDEIKPIVEKIDKKLDKKRDDFSNEMLNSDNQVLLHQKVENIIGQMTNAKINSEKDVYNHGEIISKLISEGLWPSPGGAWCSAGVPIFNKMSEGAHYPVFKHFDYEGNDVTHLANLDCQTPFYFVHLESGEYNQKVIDFYVDFLKNIQSDYNFDAYRVDHIDHIVDKFSEADDKKPISYRAPSYVLGKVNEQLKKEVPHFATLAEYMLGGNFYKEYHQDMNFDLLWGNDIVAQHSKSVEAIIQDNIELAKYNLALTNNNSKLSILKTYNNQDGEFSFINQYPAQLGEQGALFKWFKYHFLPGGKHASRPILYVDGDESFTQKGIERVIGSEESMIREKNHEFYKKFNAIHVFATNNDIIKNGIAFIQHLNSDKSGLVSWYIKRQDDHDDERLLIIANQNVINPENSKCIHGVKEPVGAIFNCEIEFLPEFKVVSEFVFSETIPSIEEKEGIFNLSSNKLFFDCIMPSEFRIYRLSRK